MANDLNMWTGIGRLGADPESRFLPDGKAVCNIRIACGWKSGDKEGAEWVTVVAFGKLAEIMGQYLVKGSQVLIRGSLRTRKWQDKAGSDRYSTEIVADTMQMLGGKPSGQQDRQTQPSRQGQPEPMPNDLDPDDQIPF